MRNNYHLNVFFKFIGFYFLSMGNEFGKPNNKNRRLFSELEIKGYWSRISEALGYDNLMHHLTVGKSCLWIEIP